jgi:hypothetical protein
MTAEVLVDETTGETRAFTLDHTENLDFALQCRESVR